jgi:prevent-host-death family protein
VRGGAAGRRGGKCPAAGARRGGVPANDEPALIAPPASQPIRWLTGYLVLAILAIMKTATITEAKNGLSALLDQVKAGESIVITDRGMPVAVIEPVTGRIDVEDRLARLERAGLIRRGTGEIPLEIMSTPAPTVRGDGLSAAEIVIEERRTGW